jgi:hypothetical protein
MTAREAASAYEIIWHKDWSGNPIYPATECPHSCGEQLSINQRLEPNKHKGRHIELDGIFCMECGTDTTGRLTVAEALHLCMEQHGWNRKVGERLYELARIHELELLDAPAIPIWCFYAFGWSGREIHKALNSGKLNPADMSEEVERLAEKVGAWRSQ